MPPSAEPGVPRRRLSRTVIGLGWVSLLTDASSELIFPLLPMFLTEVLGAPATFLGVLEGLAEGTASGVKYFSGRLADRRAQSKPIVLWGYGLSTLVRPLVAFALAPWHVLAVRIVDRVGKGIRSSPRDAMIAQSTDDADRGRAFGFHQAMDHAGSAVGTLLGAGLLALAFDLRKVFLIASIPGFLALATLFAVPEVKAVPLPQDSQPEVVAARLPAALWRYLAVLFVFTAANASDAFLILKAREVGASKVLAPLLWLVLHLVKASLGTLGGSLSDRLGRARVLVAGWVVYGVCYALLGQLHSVVTVFAVTAVYGLYGALTDGAEKAMVADLAPRSSRGRAFGVYNALNGVGLLVAGLVFGLLWDHAGSRVAFTVAGVQALVAALLLGLVKLKPAR
jgi:MFS family permease